MLYTHIELLYYNCAHRVLLLLLLLLLLHGTRGKQQQKVNRTGNLVVMHARLLLQKHMHKCENIQPSCEINIEEFEIENVNVYSGSCFVHTLFIHSASPPTRCFSLKGNGSVGSLGPTTLKAEWAHSLYSESENIRFPRFRRKHTH